MSGIKRTPANSNLSQKSVNISYGILTRPATPGTPLRSVNNSTNLEDLSHHFRRLSTRGDTENVSNSTCSFSGAGDETSNFHSENPKRQGIEKPIGGQNGAESRPLELHAQSPERTPAITDLSKVHQVQSTAIKVAYFDPVEVKELGSEGIKEVYTCAATSTASYSINQSPKLLVSQQYNNHGSKCNLQRIFHGPNNYDIVEVQNSHARVCKVQCNNDIDVDECPSSELRDKVEEDCFEEFTPQTPCISIPSNEKPFYTLENAHLCPELRQPVLNSKNITPLFQPMAAPPLAVVSTNFCPPNDAESAYVSRKSTGFDPVCNPQPDQCGNQNYNPSSNQGSHPQNQNYTQKYTSNYNQNLRQNYNQNCNTNYHIGIGKPHCAQVGQPCNIKVLQTQECRPTTHGNQMADPNPNSFPNYCTASGNSCPRPQTQMQCENFIGQIPAIYPQVPPSAYSPNNSNPTNSCLPGFSSSGYGHLRKGAVYPPDSDCHRNFTAYSQSFSRAQTAPGFKIFQMPAQGHMTAPPRTAQNMLYQMGLARPATENIVTGPLDSCTADCSAPMPPEHVPGETPVQGSVPGTENPYGHFSNNCNFFIYNVQHKGMMNGWEPNGTMLNPETNTGTGYTVHGVAPGPGFEGPKFYKPNLYPVPRAAEIRSMLRPFRRFL